jgi:hypothetical protein
MFRNPIRDVMGGRALGYGLDDQSFESRQGLGIFLLTTVCRPALGPTQPPIQWVPGALSLGVKRPRGEADHSSPSSTEVKNAWRYTSTHPWRGAQLKHRDNFTCYLTFYENSDAVLSFVQCHSQT